MKILSDSLPVKTIVGIGAAICFFKGIRPATAFTLSKSAHYPPSINCPPSMNCPSRLGFDGGRLCSTPNGKTDEELFGELFDEKSVSNPDMERKINSLLSNFNSEGGAKVSLIRIQASKLLESIVKRLGVLSRQPLSERKDLLDKAVSETLELTKLLVQLPIEEQNIELKKESIDADFLDRIFIQLQAYADDGEQSLEFLAQFNKILSDTSKPLSLKSRFGSMFGQFVGERMLEYKNEHFNHVSFSLLYSTKLIGPVKRELLSMMESAYLLYKNELALILESDSVSQDLEGLFIKYQDLANEMTKLDTSKHEGTKIRACYNLVKFKILTGDERDAAYALLDLAEMVKQYASKYEARFSEVFDGVDFTEELGEALDKLIEQIQIPGTATPESLLKHPLVTLLDKAFVRGAIKEGV